MLHNHGLVIGKFYPPHLGHVYLIDRACLLSERLTILVCDGVTDLIPPKVRANWLRAMYPNAEVSVITDGGLSNADSSGWAAHVKNHLCTTPDVVFTSESYGQPFSEFLGSKHVSVDMDRKVVPISGTAIRSNPYENWEFLPSSVKSYFVQRIAFVGAESTGKTTIAEKLSCKYETLWVPEYGREYTYLKLNGRESMEEILWNSADFVNIALEQRRREDELAEKANKVLFCDTDAFATAVWHERYIGAPSQEVRDVDNPSRISLYFLNDVRTPFFQDGIRDGEVIREWMDQRFEDAMRTDGRRYVRLTGTIDQRMTIVEEHVEALLSQPFDFCRANARMDES